MTIDAEYAAPLAHPMHTMLDNALIHYLSGDLDPTDRLVKALWEIINTADRTPELIRTLHGVIKTMTPTPELMPAIYKAIGAALDFEAPAPANTGYGTQNTAKPARTSRSSGPREGTDGDEMLKHMADQPGFAWKIGDFTKIMGGASRAGAIGSAMDRLVAKGLTVQVASDPKRYMRTDDDEAPQQAPDTTTDEADTTPATPVTPAEVTANTGTDPAPAAEPADGGKTATAARRGAAKSGK